MPTATPGTEEAFMPSATCFSNSGSNAAIEARLGCRAFASEMPERAARPTRSAPDGFDRDAVERGQLLRRQQIARLAAGELLATAEKQGLVGIAQRLVGPWMVKSTPRPSPASRGAHHLALIAEIEARGRLVEVDVGSPPAGRPGKCARPLPGNRGLPASAVADGRGTSEARDADRRAAAGQDGAAVRMRHARFPLCHANGCSEKA